MDENRNFDARIAYNGAYSTVPTPPQLAAIETHRGQFPSLMARFDPHTGITRILYNRAGYLTAANPNLDFGTLAFEFVDNNLTLLGLVPSDLTGTEVTDQVYSQTTGAMHIYLRQVHQGIPVYNGQIQVNLNRDGQVISVNNAYLSNIAGAVDSLEPALDPVKAVLNAAKQIGIESKEKPKLLQRPNGVQQFVRISAPGISAETVEARLMLLPVRRDEARLVWNFQIHTLDSLHAYDFTVDAETGSVWTRIDWVVSEQFLVYPQPVESPSHTTPLPPADGRQLVGIQNPGISPLGWFDTGSTQYTITRGNNVHAYQDSDANNAPAGDEPDCGPPLDCSFPLNLNNDPTTYTDAAVVNLFYWNNIVHDITYNYGFDEPGGNFQVNNFGLGGAGNDDVRAEAQDGSGTNNANFFTPPDGSRPRMQMYLFTSTSPRRDGDLDNGIIIHEYGHGISNRLVGGPGNTSCLGNTQRPSEGLSDWWALAYTGEVGDQGTDVRGIGTYALGQPTTGPGIRTQPYSTDPGVNNHTYQSIRTQVVPHGVGEVWAQVAWECYWALVDIYGFDPDLYDAFGGAGNQRMMLYVVEGLKNTACSPTFADVRDGIIQAAMDNYGGADVCTLWETFAAFGLGVDANDASSNSTQVTNGFALPPECQCTPQPNADAGPDQSICLGESVQIGTPALAGHSYSWSPGGQTTAQINVSPTTTTTYTVTATTSCGSEMDSVTVVVDDGGGAGLDEDFETGASGWAATGLWHLVSNSGCASPGYSSPTNAFYYGQDGSCNYSTGSTNSGTLTSPSIGGITGSSTLSFDYFRQVESYSGGSFDRTQVDILTSSGATSVFLLDSTDASAASWTGSGPISLAAFAGDTIQVRFTFNTVDNVANNFTGWFIDDVVVTGDSPCVPTNTPPDVTIATPANGSTFDEGTSINFSGSAIDAEDGDLSASLAWSSNLDGSIGSGASFSAVLSVGTHTVTASVTDSGSLNGSDAITVTVVQSPANTPPNVTITAPANGSTFDEGTSINFSGSAIDAEDGDLSGSLSWSSNLDGSIGSGASFSAVLSVGTHTVTASVTDSGSLNGSDAITVTVNPAPGGGTIFQVSFDSGADGFGYADDTFRGTSQPAYASGSFLPSGGFTGGGLSVNLGGINDADILNMSGGWSRSFTLAQAQSVSLTLRYNLTQQPNYESNEFSDALVSIDGVLVGTGGNDYLARITGNGNGGGVISTGWVQVSLELGTLSAGSHTVTIGGYNNQKTLADESTQILIDDVTAEASPPPVTVLEAHFDAGAEGFTYSDDTFRGTSQPAYASGSFLPGGGFSGGGLSVTVGGVDNATVLNMSGGWSESFTLASAESLTLTFRYNLIQQSDYESDEFSDALLSFDGNLIGSGANDYQARITGNGNGGSVLTTGWVTVQVDLGVVSAGTHSLTFGAYNNKKTLSNESSEVRIDDVVVSIQ